MTENSKLVNLVHQAASTINMVSVDDPSDLAGLLDVFDQISQQISELADLPEQLQSQAASAASSAAKYAKYIADGEDADDETIKVIADTVVSLQAIVENTLADKLDALGDISFPEFDLGDLQADIEEVSAAEETEAGEESKADAEPASEGEPAGLTIPEEDAPLILDFITEAQEHIESAEAGLLELESNPTDADSINTIFRSFHTVKGMAGFLNLQDIGSLAHTSENLLDMGRKGELVLVDEKMDVVFEAIDMLKNQISDLKAGVENGTPIGSQAGLAELLKRIEACQKPDGGKAGDKSESKPKVEKPEPTAEKAETAPQPDTEKTPAADAPKADDKPKGEDKAKTETAEKSAGSTGKSQPAKTVKTQTEEKIKVGTGRLDKLVNMAGELVIAQSMITQHAETHCESDIALSAKINQQGKIVRELQELAMLMRMVPIQGVFGKMARLVRDLSRKSGKKINFVTEGEDTELDRNVVDLIADPLVHMVRNSMDHGIEPEEDRRKAGKDPVGKLELRAFHQSGNIVIEIEDDGRGLDADKIRNKAIANGVISASQDLADHEIHKLIFHAGLSTADKITEVSGRGVGMDVVKKNIESLRGKVDISSKKGVGTKFTIRLPLTLAIIDGQVVRIGEQIYILPILAIERCIRPTTEQLSTVYGRGEMATVQGELVPVVRLYDLFDVEPDTTELTDSALVVVEEDGRKGGLVVDELLDQQQIVIKSLGESFGDLRGISGAAIMGNGKVSLILDVPGLIELAAN
ncbi:Chemotaxis protein CheA [Anaerohalosphaera lusitana]|uniref:Chemotaxis protein CheA n=1 Tax=Anaerohalosphaera lusitana TaxID=1936003 RepID=A0A1U9NG22_9BACT|nr:chemotaxis protein CheA [Anaerohalosphaera lusitana]AQT66879.1 Chemotaxis protein CheA [Anaerohalosphaera lusitana]